MGDSETGEKTYKIGDFGPAEGIVFYDKGFTSDGWRYLETAPTGTVDLAWWRGPYSTEQRVDGTETVIGSGWRNTRRIIAASARSDTNAVKMCASLKVFGYKDWFLPSKDELNLMYETLKQKSISGIKSGAYWSSSETSMYTAWFQRFMDGYQSGDGDKKHPFYVWAVRAF